MPVTGMKVRLENTGNDHSIAFWISILCLLASDKILSVRIPQKSEEIDNDGEAIVRGVKNEIQGYFFPVDF